MATKWAGRPWIIAAAMVLITVSIAALTLAFDIGTPSGAYATAPDPCLLLSDQIRRDLVGDAQPSLRRDNAGPMGGWLSHEEELRYCYWPGPATGSGSLDVTVYRFSDTQLNLGRTGAERAEAIFDTERDEFRELFRRDCSPVPAEARDNVCGIRSGNDDGFVLHVQRENLYVYVLSTAAVATPAENSAEWLERRMAEATEQILSQLDGAR